MKQLASPLVGPTQGVIPAKAAVQYASPLVGEAGLAEGQAG